MGVEVQSKILNPIIQNTSTNIKTISATLIPLILLSLKHNNQTTSNLARLNSITHEMAILIDNLEIDTNNPRFDAVNALPEYITQYLQNLKIFLMLWDGEESNNVPGPVITSSKNKVVDMYKSKQSPKCSPINVEEFLKNTNKEQSTEVTEYHLNESTKNSRLLPRQAVIELLMEYLELYRIPNNNYIDRLLEKYIPEIEKIYDDDTELFNIRKTIKVLKKVEECLIQVFKEWEKHSDDDEEWL